MTTFSKLVDDMAIEMVRPDQLDSIATYTNQSIRDLHFRPSNNSATKFDANRYEDEQSVTADGPFKWVIPSVTSFQDIEAIYCPQLDLYIDKRSPSVAYKPTDTPYSEYYWYRTGPEIAVAGALEGLDLRISYHMYPRPLRYIKAADRVVEYNPDLDAYVKIVGGGTPTPEELELETNWVLQRWSDTIREGVRAKLFKRLGDVDRTRMNFSSFETMRTTVWNSEPSS